MPAPTTGDVVGPPMLKTWLSEQCLADIVVVQELHFGCGREDAQWCMDSGWQAYTTADAGNRCAGVGIFLAPWLTKDASISPCTWSPGRLLHVRCETARLTLDVIGSYQQVHHAKRGPTTENIPTEALEPTKQVGAWAAQEESPLAGNGC